HQHAHDIDCALSHAVGEFLDRDGFRNRHLARDLFLVLVAAMAGHALNATTERGDRALTHIVGAEGIDHRETSAALLCTTDRTRRRLRRSRSTPQARPRSATGWTLRFFFFRLEHAGSGRT